jgi:hypothetical protein
MAAINQLPGGGGGCQSNRTFTTAQNLYFEAKLQLFPDCLDITKQDCK